MTRHTKTIHHSLGMTALILIINGCATAPLPTELPAAGCIDPSAAYVRSPESAQRSIMVLAGDEHPAAVRHSLALVERVGRALMDKLAAPGVRLFDASGLTLTPPTQRRLQDRELLEFARTDVREPIDQLVVYSVFADTFPEDSTFRSHLRVAARVYAIPGGNVASSGFEAADTITLNLPAVCDAACFTGIIGDAARPLGATVGAQLAKHATLNPATLGRSYPLEFYGFSSGERQRIEDELRAFPGYQSQRIEEDTPDYVRMRYASTLLATDLGHNLRSLTQCLEIPSRVEFSRDRYAVRRQDG